MIHGTADNPFSSSRLGPEGTPYLFADHGERKRFFDALERHGWRAELIGPHGSGKSTLVYTIRRHLVRRGLRVVHVQLCEERPAPPRGWTKHTAAADVVLLDGAELLGFLPRRFLRRLTATTAKGLVLTTHRPLGLCRPVRMRTRGARFRELVRRLLGEKMSGQKLPDPAEVLRRHRGDARMALFELYDRWEDAAAAKAPLEPLSRFVQTIGGKLHATPMRT